MVSYTTLGGIYLAMSLLGQNLMAKVIIAGGRDIVDQSFVNSCITSILFEGGVSEVVCGGAKGVDTLGKQWAESMKIPVKMFPADWNKHGKAAGPIRNQEMSEYADVLVACWDKTSKGTKHMIDTMLSLGKEVHVFIYQGSAL